ncbi:MAG TPA: TIGR03560 family F420-dependent LLM class oxidoreductase [Thermomicrobiaceae bacterium]|nr:TIGR03560 family F420-dependent LLM class oxidoreductase [Thermomicrobiaceae bacterium]
MAELGVMIEAQEGLTWERWEALIDAAERLGYACLRRSDHLGTTVGGAGHEGLALWPTLTMAALRSRRIRFGQMVSPITWRNPVLMARNAASLDRLSGGRMELGLGAGWNEREHHAYGIPFPPLGQRMDMLEEALQVVRLLHSGEPVSFAGHHYQLHDAVSRPTPTNPSGIPIVIGGSGEKRTLPLAARYADEWNTNGVTRDEYRAKSETLDRLCAEVGRDPRAIRRSLMIAHLVGRDRGELVERVRRLCEVIPSLRDLSPDAAIAALRERRWLVGTPDEVVEQIAAWQEVGVELFMLQTLDQTDVAALELIAAEVMPRVGRSTSR